MSEAKFVVGQWVRHFDGTIKKWDDTRSYGEGREWDWKPFLWQVGKTYRTTLDGVTATVDGMMGSDRITVACDWEHDTEGIHAATFNVGTGLLTKFENRDDVPHLLPCLADEPPPVAEAATYSEFADGGECDKDLNALESMLDEFVAERMACEVELRTSRDLVSRWESRIDAWQHAEKIAREKIEREKR